MKIVKKCHRYPKREDVDNQIEEILKSFDFDEISKMMNSVDWTWWHIAKTPDAIQLKAAARNQLQRVTQDLKQEYFTISSGGFTSIFQQFKDSDGKYFRIDLFWGFDSTCFEALKF